MSGIAAIIHFDGRPVADGAIERMTAAMDYRGPDGRVHWRDDNAALGFCAMHTTPESSISCQPLSTPDGSILIVFDGLLHNIDDLRVQLHDRGERQSLQSDAEIALAAYVAWGDLCASRFEGEFAFLIWDRRVQRALLARDHIGIRPLHHHWDDRRLIVASDVAGIFANQGVEKQLNRQMIAEIAANEWLSSNQTIWKDVCRLQPATACQFSEDGPRFRTYWSPPTDVSIVYANDSDYADHYRELLTESVRHSARSQSLVACDVSGGLDSSAVFATAVDLGRAGRINCPGVRGYTYSFDDSAGPEADELAYAMDVAAHAGETLIPVKPFLPPLEWFAARAKEDQNLPPYPNIAMAVGIGRRLTADGGRVLLNGEGGDEWSGGRYYHLHENLAAGDWRRFFRSSAELMKAFGLGPATAKLARFALLPAVNDRIRSLAQSLVQPKGPNLFDGADWLTVATEQRLVNARARKDLRAFHGIANRPRRSMMHDLKGPFRSIAYDQINRQASRLGYEVRMPMHARPLIEFAFATPEHIRLRDNLLKYTHRKAMQSLLPKSVLEREDKADFSIAFALQLERLEDYFNGPLDVSRREYLRADGLRKLFARYRSLPLMEAPIWELWGAYACFTAFAPEGEML